MKNPNTLSSLICVNCDAAIEPEPAPTKTCTKYEDCLRICRTCGIGYSIAGEESAVKLIFSDPTIGLPTPVQPLFTEVLSQSLNCGNLVGKMQKASFLKSEDTVTWTVFRSLQLSKKLLAATSYFMKHCHYEVTTSPTMMLWGVEVGETGIRTSSDRREHLIRLLDGLHEPSYTEPDVVLDFGRDGLAIIEVKLFSGNSIESYQEGKWNKYLSEEYYADNRTEMGYYELSRNWRVGCELAGDRPFALINLGPNKLSKDESRFRKAIKETDKRQFHFVDWKDWISYMRTFDILDEADPLSRFLKYRRVGENSDTTMSNIDIDAFKASLQT